MEKAKIHNMKSSSSHRIGSYSCMRIPLKLMLTIITYNDDHDCIVVNCIEVLQRNIANVNIKQICTLMMVCWWCNRFVMYLAKMSNESYTQYWTFLHKKHSNVCNPALSFYTSYTERVFCSWIDLCSFSTLTNFSKVALKNFPNLNHLSNIHIFQKIFKGQSPVKYSN